MRKKQNRHENKDIIEIQIKENTRIINTQMRNYKK